LRALHHGCPGHRNRLAVVSAGVGLEAARPACAPEPPLLPQFHFSWAVRNAGAEWAAVRPTSLWLLRRSRSAPAARSRRFRALRACSSPLRRARSAPAPSVPPAGKLRVRGGRRAERAPVRSAGRMRPRQARSPYHAQSVRLTLQGRLEAPQVLKTRQRRKGP